jgi:nucleotide-binding universal stress UspA family protein
MIPPRTILAAVDFSDASRAALGLAARLARRGGSDLHVLHVEHPLLEAAAQHAGIDLTGETRDELHRFIASATPPADGSSHAHVATGLAAEVILEQARRLRADLIVVGGRGMSGAEKLVFGSTADGVIRRSDISVLVVPAEWTAPNPTVSNLSGVGPVVLGVDVADPSMAGVKAACALASMFGTSIDFVHVVPDLAVLKRWRGHAEVAIRNRMTAARCELELRLRAAGCAVPSQLRVEAGSVPDRLAEAASSGHGRAPIIVLGKKPPGTQGSSPGTTAYRLLSIAKVPVLMCVDA